MEKTEAGGPLGEVEEWNHVELEQNLTHFSMLNNCPPGIVESGAWCGGPAVWAYKLWGANVRLWFGAEAEQNLSLVSSTLLGLGGGWRAGYFSKLSFHPGFRAIRMPKRGGMG